MSEGDFCLLISFSGRGDRVGPWDGGGHAWEMVCGITLGPTGMAKEGGGREGGGFLCPSPLWTEECWNRKCPAYLSCLLDTKLEDLEGCFGSPEEMKGEGGGALVFLPLVGLSW